MFHILLEFLPGFLPCKLTFFWPLQLVIVVVDFFPKYVSTMLNACVISSFMQLVFPVICLQGLSVLFACIGSGDSVRVLRLYTTNTLDILLKHLLLRHMYNFAATEANVLRAQALGLWDFLLTPNYCSRTVLWGALYTVQSSVSQGKLWYL